MTAQLILSIYLLGVLLSLFIWIDPKAKDQRTDAAISALLAITWPACLVLAACILAFVIVEERRKTR